MKYWLVIDRQQILSFAQHNVERLNMVVKLSKILLNKGMLGEMLDRLTRALDQLYH